MGALLGSYVAHDADQDSVLLVIGDGLLHKQVAGNKVRSGDQVFTGDRFVAETQMLIVLSVS